VRRPSRRSKRPLGDLSAPRDADEESRDLDLCYVTAGRLDGCYEQGFSAWDVAAGVLILREAGGEAVMCSEKEVAKDVLANRLGASCYAISSHRGSLLPWR